MNKAKGVAKIQDEIRLPRDIYVSCEGCCAVEESVDYEDAADAAKELALSLWNDGWRVNELTGYLMCPKCILACDQQEQQRD